MTDRLYLLTSFTPFEIHESSHISLLEGPFNSFKELISAIYQIEMKALVYVVVICVLLLGASFQLPQDEQGRKQSKAWALRIFLCIPLIFSMAALIAKIFSIGA